MQRDHGAHDGGQATLPRMPAAVYRFADFRLDTAARELQRDGALVALPPRAFDCLAYLIERRERAVGRERRDARTIRAETQGRVAPSNVVWNTRSCA